MTQARRPAEMSCQELVEVITEYLENTLAPDDRRRFEEHLAECEGCATYLEQMRETIATLGKLPQETVPQEVMDKLLRVFRSYRRVGQADLPPTDGAI